MRTKPIRTTAAGAALLLALAACGSEDDGAASDDTASSTAASSASPSTPSSSATERRTRASEPTSTDTDLAKKAKEAEKAARGGVPDDARVVAISVDGLGSQWVTPALMPTVSRMISQGAGTRNARTEVEQTETLPNHTGMVTGRPIDGSGGHGVTWNTDNKQTVRAGVQSVFSIVHDDGGSCAVIVGKSKFDLWPQSWPGAIDDFQVQGAPTAAASAAVRSVRAGRDLTFLHIAVPDRAGHASGWGSSAYQTAVRQADTAVGQVVAAISGDADLADEMVVILTADHGGIPGEKRHGVPTVAADYTIPFVLWGAGIDEGDLYALNPDYRDPGSGRPGYAGPQPVRNGDVANLATDLLGLPAVPGSTLDARHDLTVSED